MHTPLLQHLSSQTFPIKGILLGTKFFKKEEEENKETEDAVLLICLS